MKKGIKLGVKLINDISGLKFDDQSINIIKKNNIPFIIHHIQGNPLTMQKNPSYNNLIKEICNFFSKQIQLANSAGIDSQNIILDPGIGFGKRVEDNFEIIRELQQICAMGLPVLIGPSRKSFIGEVLNLPVEERLEGTMASITVGIINGANIVRVHDVIETKRTISIVEKLLSEN